MKIITFIVVSAILTCHSQAQKKIDGSDKKSHDRSTIENIEKTEDEWKKELTKEEYYVLRRKGTERAFTGDLWDNKKKGKYICAACDLELFDSKTKFVSRTGWPSFYEPVNSECVAEDVDYQIGYKRVEVLCARCGGHLGHVFSDGPKPTGLRYCINSIALDFVENDKKK